MAAMFLAYMPPRSLYDSSRLNNIQGKVAELRLELNSGGKKDKNHAGKKIALKKIVANMTMSNNDMVALFPDIIGCMGIQSLEIKKMCFLFLVNYARIRPEIAVKAIPVLEHDMEDHNPLVRALALRTMSYIHVREFVEATVPIVKHMLKDGDPYVRKTAAFCVAKLYDHDRHMVEGSDLIDRLNSLLRDDNPTVVASALAGLMDIWERSDAIKLTIDYSNASKMVAILPDCSEWGQTYILEALMSYVPQESGEAILLAERISPRLSHSNSSEATVVIRNIFRKYPNQYESIISTLCEHLDSLDEPEAKAAMVWVIGQYADRIENSDALLEDFLYSFAEEPVEVQLALLTATVKLFIQRPTKGQELVPKVLKWATEETDNPDLRDRAYMYWRLLSTDMNAARKIVMGEKPAITAESERLDATTLEEMCLNVGTLATVYLKPVQTVFRSARPRKLQDSPALQKQNLLVSVDSQKSISMFGNAGAATDIDPRSRNPTSSEGQGNIAQAVNDADAYFSSIGTTQQMQPMHVDQGDDVFGGGNGHSTGYVVSAHAPQAVLQPAQGAGSNGDLLVL
ncbi:adaptin N terminal region-domain-containing protein [Fusarium acuminatum]|uniref:AP complex subunit beta n=1 Tax=Fusarium acuminatum TaxID=5515 RepID=A0ABZ2WKZ2_9HYPO